MAGFDTRMGRELRARVAGDFKWDVVRAYFLAGSLEALVFDGKINVWDINTTDRIPFLEKVPRQYVVQGATIIPDHLFLRACQNQQPVFRLVHEAFPETANYQRVEPPETLGSLSSIVYVAPPSRHR